MVRRHVGRQRLQALQRRVRLAQRQQRMRLQRVAQQLLRVLPAHAARTLHRIGGAAALDQRMRGRQAVGRVSVVQRGRLLEGRGCSAPALASGVVLPGLPVPEGLQLGACRRRGALGQ